MRLMLLPGLLVALILGGCEKHEPTKPPVPLPLPPPAGTVLDVDLARVVRRKIQIKGSYGARARQDVPALIRLLAAGRLDLSSVISRRVGLEQAPETYQALDRGEVLGRAVVLTGA